MLHQTRKKKKCNFNTVFVQQLKRCMQVCKLQCNPRFYNISEITEKQWQPSQLVAMDSSWVFTFIRRADNAGRLPLIQGTRAGGASCLAGRRIGLVSWRGQWVVASLVGSGWWLVLWAGQWAHGGVWGQCAIRACGAIGRLCSAAAACGGRGVAWRPLGRIACYLASQRTTQIPFWSINPKHTFSLGFSFSFSWSLCACYLASGKATEAHDSRSSHLRGA